MSQEATRTEEYFVRVSIPTRYIATEGVLTMNRTRLDWRAKVLRWVLIPIVKHILQVGPVEGAPDVVEIRLQWGVVDA